MKRNMSKNMGILGAVLLGLIIILAVAGPALVPYNPTEQSGLPLQAPGGQHLLGTNDMGQDIMAELVEGARISLTIGIVSAFIATLIGTVLGLISGYGLGWLDALIMRVVDVSMTLPFLPLMIVVGVYMGPSLFTQIAVITLVMWAGKAREIRSQVLSLRSRGPVLAARSMGAGHLYVLRKHVFPSVVPLMIPQFVRAVNTSIMLESSLSFLGLGDPLSKSWGSILFYANARSAFLTDAWLWWVLPPGLCIVVTVLAFSFIGYWLEERVSPRLRAYTGAFSKLASGRFGKTKKPNPIAVRQPDGASAEVLRVEGLSVQFPQPAGNVRAVEAVSFTLRRGEVLGIVGESGSGKTTIAAAVMQLLKPPAEISGSICFDGKNLAQLSPVEMNELRGSRIALIPQAAMNALNPVMTIKSQLAEAMVSHRSIGKAEVLQRVSEVLGQVGLDPKWGDAYPHELSGGMKQRVVIAMALINGPDLIIADEPTTGLDVLVQTEIIKLLDDLQQRLGLAMIFISHDLPVVLRLADRILIMKQGEMVDEVTAEALTASTVHPYTRRLMDSIPRLRAKKAASVSSLTEAEAGGGSYVRI